MTSCRKYNRGCVPSFYSIVNKYRCNPYLEAKNNGEEREREYLKERFERCDKMIEGLVLLKQLKLKYINQYLFLVTNHS